MRCTINFYLNLFRRFLLLRRRRRRIFTVFVSDFAVPRAIVVTEERFVTESAAERPFTRVHVTAMNIPGILSLEFLVAVIAGKRLTTDVKQNVVVQRLGVVESLATLRALVSLLTTVLVLDVVNQQLLDLESLFAQVALVYRTGLALVRFLPMRLERHLMLELLVTLAALEVRLLISHQRVLAVDLMVVHQVALHHAESRQGLHAQRTREPLGQRDVLVVYPVFLQVIDPVLLLSVRLVTHLAGVHRAGDVSLGVKPERVAGCASHAALVALVRLLARVRSEVFLQSHLELKRFAAQLAYKRSRAFVHEHVMFEQRVLRAKVLAARAANDVFLVLVVPHHVKFQSIFAYEARVAFRAVKLTLRDESLLVSVDHHR